MKRQKIGMGGNPAPECSRVPVTLDGTVRAADGLFAPGLQQHILWLSAKGMLSLKWSSAAIEVLKKAAA